MSDEPNKPDVLAILCDRLKDLQSQAIGIRDRVEEVELMIAAVERAGRKRPGPKPRVVPPQTVVSLPKGGGLSDMGEPTDVPA